MSEDVKYKFTFCWLPRFHHRGDGFRRLPDKVPLCNSVDLQKGIVHLSFALKFVSESRLLLLFWVFRETADVFRLNVIGYDGESLKCSHVVWDQFEASVKNSSGSIDVVFAHTEVIPTDNLKSERDESVLGWLKDSGKFFCAYLPNSLKVWEAQKG